MLLDKDIVSDFFSVVGLNNPPSKVSVQANPSLAGNLFFFKLFLNRMMQGGKTPDPIVAQFESLSNQNPKWRGRLDLGDALRRKIEDFSSVQEEEVRKAFGITFPHRQQGFLSGIDTSTLREDFDHMCNALHTFKSDLRTEDFVRAADHYLTDRNAR